MPIPEIIIVWNTSRLVKGHAHDLREVVNTILILWPNHEGGVVPQRNQDAVVKHKDAEQVKKQNKTKLHSKQKQKIKWRLFPSLRIKIGEAFVGKKSLRSERRCGRLLEQTLEEKQKDAVQVETWGVGNNYGHLGLGRISEAI